MKRGWEMNLEDGGTVYVYEFVFCRPDGSTYQVHYSVIEPLPTNLETLAKEPQDRLISVNKVLLAP